MEKVKKTFKQENYKSKMFSPYLNGERKKVTIYLLTYQKI